MKKNKKLILATCILMALQGCQDKAIQNNDINAENPFDESKEIAIEIIQHKETLQFQQAIEDDENSEFVQGDYLKHMTLQTKMLKNTSTEPNDTINDADLIPLFDSEEIQQVIYVDGTFVFTAINTTPLDSNYFYLLEVEIAPEEERITKTIVKEGTVFLYNTDNKLVGTEEVGVVNYKPMLDTIQQAIALETRNALSTKSTQTLKAERRSTALRRAQSSGMKLVSQTGDEVVMQIVFDSQESALPMLKNQATVQRKATMRFSGDMTRMIEQKVYENNQLIQSINYEYIQDNQLHKKNASVATRNVLPNMSVKQVTQKSLQQKMNGEPYILVHQERYTKNEITINL